MKKTKSIVSLTKVSQASTAPPRVWAADPVNEVRLSVRDFVLQMLLNGVASSELLGLVPTAEESDGIEVLVASRSVYGIKAAVLANATRWPEQRDFTLLRASDFEWTDSLPDDERRLLQPEVVARFTVLGGLPAVGALKK